MMVGVQKSEIWYFFIWKGVLPWIIVPENTKLEAEKLCVKGR